MPTIKKTIIRIALLALAVVLVLSAAAAGYFMWRGPQMVKAINEAWARVGPVDLAKVPDGVYKDAFGDFVVSAEVETIVKAGRIVSVVVTKQPSGPGHKAEALPACIVERQSPKVDLVAGASASSKTIMVAVFRSLTGPK
jgi:uncharacterized protein with FMN-binding domain